MDFFFQIEKASFPILCPSENCTQIIEVRLLFDDFSDNTITNYYKFNYRNHLIEENIIPVFFLF